MSNNKNETRNGARIKFYKVIAALFSVWHGKLGHEYL
jgi:hypothetical protein